MPEFVPALLPVLELAATFAEVPVALSVKTIVVLYVPAVVGPITPVLTSRSPPTSFYGLILTLWPSEGTLTNASKPLLVCVLGSTRNEKLVDGSGGTCGCI